MTLEEALKKIDAQRAVIERFAAALKRKNETIEELSRIIHEMEKEVSVYRINQERAKENVSPLIIEKSKRGK